MAGVRWPAQPGAGRERHWSLQAAAARQGSRHLTPNVLPDAQASVLVTRGFSVKVKGRNSLSTVNMLVDMYGNHRSLKNMYTCKFTSTLTCH